MAIVFAHFQKFKKMFKKVLSFSEGCDFLGYKKSYVYKLTSNGILPFSKPNGRKIFFDREKLEAWMLSNASKSLNERQEGGLK